MTTIEWTRSPDGTEGKTWNPVVGCSRVSAGCEHCYAERVAHRGMTEAHRGLTVLGKHGPRWTGEVRCLPERLDEPLRWRKPRRVFVNSMSDLFHEKVPFEYIAAVFGVMAAVRRHTFQVLTKRPARAAEFFAWLRSEHSAQVWKEARKYPSHNGYPPLTWPLRNVWLGVSVEDQATADERIPVLLTLPAAVRWVSYEPALGPVNWRWVGAYGLEQDVLRFGALPRDGWVRGLDWIVVGGESGPGARPFDLAWARSTIAQCRAAGVPVFVKQLGARPMGPLRGLGGEPLDTAGGMPARVGLRLRDRKGGDPSEWPEDLRVREEPA